MLWGKHYVSAHPDKAAQTGCYGTDVSVLAISSCIHFTCLRLLWQAPARGLFPGHRLACIQHNPEILKVNVSGTSPKPMTERILVHKYPASVSYRWYNSGVCSLLSPKAPQGEEAPDVHGINCFDTLLTYFLFLCLQPPASISFLLHFTILPPYCCFLGSPLK